MVALLPVLLFILDLVVEVADLFCGVCEEVYLFTAEERWQGPVLDPLFWALVVGHVRREVVLGFAVLVQFLALLLGVLFLDALVDELVQGLFVVLGGLVALLDHVLELLEVSCEDDVCGVWEEPVELAFLVVRV